MIRGKPLSFDRQAVLAKAMELFWSNGYEATGVTELLEHVGIQRQSFYNTFGSKQDVFVAALDLYIGRQLASIQEQLNASPSAVENLENLLDLWASQMSGHTGTGCLLGNTIAEFGGENAAVSGVCKKAISTLENALTKTFQKAIDQKELPAQRKARALARTMITISQGLALLSKNGMSDHAIQDVLATAKRTLLN